MKVFGFEVEEDSLPELKKFMGMEEEGAEEVTVANPFEMEPLQQEDMVAGDGTSTQTQRGLLESGVHPNNELQKRYDEKKNGKVGKPTYQEKGKTQMEEYEELFGKDAAAQKRKEQDEDLKRLIQKRRG